MELPSEWVEKADIFFREAKRHIEEGVYWLSCFEAQQAAELYLKALHVAAADPSTLSLTTSPSCLSH
ncbi:MAG: HEPN domain-containing protein [Thermofilum sp.]